MRGGGRVQRGSEGSEFPDRVDEGEGEGGRERGRKGRREVGK